jgi:hypothetical protein
MFNYWLIENLLVSVLAVVKRFKSLQGKKKVFIKTARNVLYCVPHRFELVSSYFLRTIDNNSFVWDNLGFYLLQNTNFKGNEKFSDKCRESN